MAILLRHRNHGTSVLRRFAAEDSGGLWAGEWEPGGVGPAVWGQPRLHQEDPQTAVAERADGASAATVRDAQPDDAGSAIPVAGDDPSATGPDVGRVAIQAVREQPSAVECVPALAGDPEDGTALKKKSLHAQEQNTPENRERREAWREQIKQVDPRQWVVVDESGVTTEMTRRYGRALRGERVQEATPAGHWSTLTLLEHFQH